MSAITSRECGSTSVLAGSGGVGNITCPVAVLIATLGPNGIRTRVSVTITFSPYRSTTATLLAPEICAATKTRRPNLPMTRPERTYPLANFVMWPNGTGLRLSALLRPAIGPGIAAASG